MTLTVLVTGGAGFVGSHTCKALAQAGYLPVAYDNLSNGHVRSVKWGPLEQGDLGDGARLREVLVRHRPVAILHFAASIEAGESVKHPKEFYQNNVLGTLSLLKEMIDAQIGALVFSSTAAVYGKPSALPIAEGQSLQPENPYGNTKLVVERALADFAIAYGIRYCVLRYFNAAGADPDSDLVEGHTPESHLIPLAIQAAAHSDSQFRVFGRNYATPDGTCIRDYVHVSDLAKGHVLALQRLLAGEPPIIANLGTGVGHSVLDVLREVEICTDRKINLIFADRRQGDPPILIADPSLAKRELGWSPQYPELRTQVQHAVASLKKHRMIKL